MTDDRLSLRAWLWTAAACLASLAASFVPVPGLDQEVMRAMAGSSGGLLGLFDVAAPMVSVVNLGTGLLILVRGVLRLVATAETPPERVTRNARIGFAIYVVLAFAAGLVTAIWAEAAGVPGADGIVVDPGWGSRLLIALTLTAGAVISWLLATLISRRGVGQGPLVLFGLSVLLQGGTQLVEIGPDLTQLGWQPLVLVGRLASLAAPIIVLVAAWRFSPERWPIVVTRGVAVTSPVDLLCLPPMAAAVVLAPAGTILASLSAPGSVGPHGELVHAIVTTLAAVLIALWLRRRSAGRASSGWLVAALAGGLLALALSLASLLDSGAVTDALAPGPYDGERTAVIELRAEGGDGAADSAVLLRRLSDVGLAAHVRAAETGLIRLEILEVGDLPGALDAVLPPRAVSFRLLDDDQGALRATGEPPVPGLEPHDAPEMRLWSAPTPEALEPLREQLPAGVRERALVECLESRCLLRLLEAGPALVGPRDIADAGVRIDEMDGRPNVFIEMTPAGAARFGEATGASIGRFLAIVVDDRIVSAPKIMSAIPGGRAQITLGAGKSFPELLREADALSAALRSGPLGARWELASER